MKIARRLYVILFSTIAAVIALAMLYTWAALHWAYSEGERTGYLQKISKRGYICKTWEGEILMSPTPGAIPEKFSFSVRDDALAHDMEKLLGKPVVLTYAQRKGVPSSCFGDTEYFIEKARLSKP
ncbi:MAG: hypothetical protein RL748_2969 [Pseudomonadota bacterium]|jgi:hypothetical protein